MDSRHIAGHVKENVSLISSAPPPSTTQLYMASLCEEIDIYNYKFTEVK